MDIRVVKSPILANKLLKLGYVIVGLRPNRQDSKLTVFMFKYKDGIDIIIQEFIKEYNGRRLEQKLLNGLVCF